jgi:predicted membrane protein
MVDEIRFLGIGWNLLVIVIFLGATFFITQHCKKRLAPLTTKKKVYLSWAIGAIVFFSIGIFRPEQVTFGGIVQYFFLTLLLNGVYKGNTLLWDLLASKFSFIPPRKKPEAPAPPSAPQA